METGKLEVSATGSMVLKGTNKNGSSFSMNVKQKHLEEQFRNVPVQKRAGAVVYERDSNAQPFNIRLAKAPPAPAPANQASARSAGPANRNTPAAPRGAVQPEQSAQMPGNFHNPYNFVPTPTRDLRHPTLGDAVPVGHHRYYPELFTGRIQVTLTTATPLLLPDAAKLEVVEPDHKVFPARRGPDGKPWIAPTSIKGMLSSAFEAVTNSRMRVFTGHDRRLAYRMEAKIDCEPARVELGSDGNLVIRVFKKSFGRSPARLPRYNVNSRSTDKGESQAALRYVDTDELPRNGDHVWVRVSQSGKAVQILAFDVQPTRPEGNGWYEGWVYITGPNINKKAYERIFVKSEQDLIVPVEDSLPKKWADLILDYQKTHSRELKQREEKKIAPNDYLGDEPGKTGWSTHVFTPGSELFQEGLLCYVKVGNASNSSHSPAQRDQRSYGRSPVPSRNTQNNRITAIFPVTISRRLHEYSPADLLDATLRPALRLGELSPADRTFGWVSADANTSRSQDSAGENAVVAYRGRLRVGAVTCQAPKEKAIQSFGVQGVPLAILSTPKPSQGRFYVANANGSPVAGDDPGYSDEKQRLRGRKVFPHHKPVAGPQNAGYWNGAPANGQANQPYNNTGYHQEYHRAGGTRDNQNRSMKEWVPIGTTFAFPIDVVNLSEVELGALLWLLSLPEGSFHRLGGGKPLGFGSVRLQVTSLDLHSGTQWAQYYQAFDNDPVPSTQELQQKAIAAFQAAVVEAYGAGPDRAFETISFIKAFLNAAQGFDGRPIHYPRATLAPNQDGENFKWFGDHRKIPLPLLENDQGLPQ